MKTILCVDQYIFVDDVDYEEASRYPWRLNGAGYPHAAEKECHGKSLFLHQLVYRRMYGFIPIDKDIHHKNNNRLDCRRFNLEALSLNTHRATRKKQQNNSTGYKGVCFDVSKAKYVANICVKSKTMYLGRYFTAEEAARAYDAKAKELHGSHALLNFPNDPLLKTKG